ncbi:MAG: circularly permuted type 2 ATP-grasp protein, partial [Pseudomonadota bacterium]
MFNEMYDGDRIRPEYEAIASWIERSGADSLHLKRAEAERLSRKIGITFTVYGDAGDPERLIPFDIIPRIFSRAEWDLIERGVKQRASALNAFLRDAYGPGEIFKAGHIPLDVVRGNKAFEHQMAGVEPPLDVFA